MPTRTPGVSAPFGPESPRGVEGLQTRLCLPEQHPVGGHGEGERRRRPIEVDHVDRAAHQARQVRSYGQEWVGEAVVRHPWGEAHGDVSVAARRPFAPGQ